MLTVSNWYFFLRHRIVFSFIVVGLRIAGGRKLKGRNVLYDMSGQPNSGVASWYRATIEEEINRGYQVRQPFWSEALGVDSEE